MELRAGSTNLLRAELAAQHALAGVLAEAPELQNAARRLLEAVGINLGCRVGALWETDERAGRIRLLETWYAPGTSLPAWETASREIEFARGAGMIGRIWSTGEPEWIDDLGDRAAFLRLEAAERSGLTCAVAFPVTSGGRILGVMELYSPELLPQDRELVDMLRSFGAQVGQFLERRMIEEVVELSEAFKTAILESALDCVVAMDDKGIVLEFNPAAEQTFGYPREEAIGRELAGLIIPPESRDAHRAALRRVVETGEARLLDRLLRMEAMRADGSRFPVELTITRLEVEGPPLFAGYIRDISEHQREEDAQRFLAETGRVLAGSLDYTETLRRVAALAVPAIADWCAIDLRNEDGVLEQVALAHGDPEKEELARELQERYPRDPAGEWGVPKVVRTGEAELYREIPEELLEEVAQDADHLRLVRSLGLGSAMVVPMGAGARTIGAITLVNSASRRGFDERDLDLGRDLAFRAGLAVENARTYGERSHIAEVLQRSLLPAHLPEMPGFEVASRFWAAGKANEVGGDFYEVFPVPGDRWFAVVGDVCGKGPDAAAITAIARHTLRAGALRQACPTEALTLLNEALLGEGTELRFCTAAAVLLEPRDGEVKATVAVGGHPLPLLVRGSGATPVGVPGTLLGVVDDPNVTNRELTMRAGDTLVLYTDGVVEGTSAGFGEGDLIALLGETGGEEVEEVARRVEAAARSGSSSPRDDIAVLVLRFMGGFADSTGAGTSIGETGKPVDARGRLR